MWPDPDSSLGVWSNSFKSKMIPETLELISCLWKVLWCLLIDSAPRKPLQLTLASFPWILTASIYVYVFPVRTHGICKSYLVTYSIYQSNLHVIIRRPLMFILCGSLFWYLSRESLIEPRHHFPLQLCGTGNPGWPSLLCWVLPSLLSKLYYLQLT